MTSRLADAASPYLRAHARNPVPWHPWGAAAFDEARRRDVPVLVSIGYSTCHWCHVMARESFEDAAIGALVADGFVAIKVDREEHPEVDAAYLAAAAAFTPSLGWPLTVFATPDGRPFFAGTYFPPEPRAGLPAFAQVLAAVREAWTGRRAQVDGTGAALLEALASVQPAGHADASPTLDDLRAAADALAAREDPAYGGFGTGEGPKFPVATALRFLQSRALRGTAAAAVATRSLAAMAASPLRDPVEGGFFRYATRPDWTMPHYERMLTDNALLLDVAADAGDADAASGVAGFLRDVLQQPGGGFGAAQDSESWIDETRSEGGYYQRDDRAGLEPPAVDGKIVTGWNGLAIGALARAGARSGAAGWIETARRAANAVLTANARDDGTLVRASLDEIPSRSRATLADHGQLAAGLGALALATGDVAYAVQARDLVRACARPDGAVAAPGGGDPVLAAQGLRAPDAASDADEPSGVAAVAEASALLATLGDDTPLPDGSTPRELASRLVAAHAAAALAQPLAHGSLLRVAASLAAPTRQVVVVADDVHAPLAVAARALDADVATVVSTAQAAAWAEAGFALFAGKTLSAGAATAYDCRDFACRLPITDPALLEA